MSSTQQQAAGGFGSQWHMYILYGMGILALIALAGPYPSIATWIVVLLIALVLLSNWSTYAQYLGQKG